MSSVIRTIEKRMKKFVSQVPGTPSQSSNSCSELKKVRLNPLDNTPVLHHKNYPSDALAVKKEKSLAQLSVDLTKAANSNSLGKMKSKIVVKLKEKCKKKQGIFKVDCLKLLRNLAVKARNRFIDKRVIFALFEWKKTLKKHLGRIISAFRIRKSAAVIIQKTWKMLKFRKNFKKLVKSVKIIQRIYKNLRNFRKIQKIKSILLFFYCLDKLREEKEQLLSDSALKIQKNFRRYQTFKKFHQEIMKKTEKTMHEKLKQRQIMLLKERRGKKQAVRTIEREYLKYLHRRRLRKLRQYLKTIPYECRLLYLKFKQVKRDTNALQSDLQRVLNTNLTF